MAITHEEYKAPLTRMRQAMADEDLDALLVYSWKRGQVRYVSAYAPDYIANVAMAVIPRRQEPTLFIRFPFDLERAGAMCWFDDVRPSGDVSAVGRDTATKLRELRLDRDHIGSVSGDGVMDELPYTLYQQLRDDLPEAEFSDARGLTADLRLTKSPAEFALLKQSARVADAAVAAARETLAPGSSEYAVVAAAEATARAAGAEAWQVAITCQGTQELIGPPEDKIIEPESVVILGVAAQVGGYWTQVARAFVVGEPTAGQRAIYEAVRRAYSAAVDAARPGKTLGTVGQAACAILGAAGYAGHIEYDVGHGIGLDLPEPPRVELSAEEPVHEGMVIVIHPAVMVPGVGGAFIGGTVLATKDAPLPIHEIPGRLT